VISAPGFLQGLSSNESKLNSCAGTPLIAIEPSNSSTVNLRHRHVDSMLKINSQQTLGYTHTLLFSPNPCAVVPAVPLLTLKPV
jgi:hypothetical protein